MKIIGSEGCRLRGSLGGFSVEVWLVEVWSGKIACSVDLDRGETRTSYALCWLLRYRSVNTHQRWCWGGW